MNDTGAVNPPYIVPSLSLSTVATVISIRLPKGVKITWITLFSKHHDFKTNTNLLIQFVTLFKDLAAGCSLILCELKILRQIFSQKLLSF